MLLQWLTRFLPRLRSCSGFIAPGTFLRGDVIEDDGGGQDANIQMTVAAIHNSCPRFAGQ